VSSFELRIKSEELRVSSNIAKRFLHSSFFILHFALILFSAFAAEEPKISVKAELSKAFITIGDPVTYIVQIQHVPEIKILSAVNPPDPNILRVTKSEDIQKKEGNRLYEGKKFTVTAFSLGEYVLEPQKIQYLDTDGQTKTLQTDKIYLTVKSVAEGEEKSDIRGIKGVVALPKKVMRWVFLALVLLVVFLIFYLFNKRRIVLPKIVTEPELTNEEEALMKLNRLFDSDLVRNGKIKEYYLRLSEILRSYFEKRFQIPAVEATTFEIQRSLKTKEVDQSLREQINEVLEAADLAKFAKWKPEPAQIVQIQQKSKQLIELSRPKETAGGI
jgi:hypothetical protein